MQELPDHEIVKARSLQDQNWESFREFWDKATEEEHDAVICALKDGKGLMIADALGEARLCVIFQIFFEEIIIRSYEKARIERELQ